MKQIRIRSVCFLLLFPILLAAQTTQVEFVVEFHGQDFASLVNRLAFMNGKRNLAVENIKAFSQNKDNVYYTVKVPANEFDSWRDLLLKNADVRHVEIDTPVEKRNNVPNDPRVTDQWYLKNIQAYEAWMVTQGGLNAEGKEVVIAVIDDGFDIQHEDLQDIYYQNAQETAGDNIDNDGNGYVDDFQGYNIKTGNGVITAERHGTNVIGVLGARGNNQIGIAGINWNIKILPIIIPTTSAGVEAALNYVIQMRKLYDATDGQKGANIVATTYSGGISRRFATEFPIWCGLYDKLGELGIISVGATSNNNDDVDIVGDIPSTCESNFLIVVTNSNSRDVKVRDAGYGKTHVDMAVPGENILTTVNTAGKYTYETGTSLSAPILAGAISLLHTVDCEAFQDDYKEKPRETTLALIDIILNSGDNAFYLKAGQNAPLKDITTTGKRLNIHKALDSLQLRYNNCIPDFNPPGQLRIRKVIADGFRAIVRYETPTLTEIRAIVFDANGQLIVENFFTPTSLTENTWTFEVKKEIVNDASYSQVYFIGFSQGKQKAGTSFGFFR